MTATTPLLTYAINTTPNPLTVGLPDATITLECTNNTGSPVSLDGIKLTLKVGQLADDLTNLPAQIATALPPNWIKHPPQQQPGEYSFVFTTAQPVSTVQIPQGNALVFVLSNIQLNAAPGTTQIILEEGSAGNPICNLNISVFPASWASVFFNVSNVALTAPGNVTLSWNGPASASYQIEYIDPVTQIRVIVPSPLQSALASTGSYPGQGQPPLFIDATTTFSLIVNETVNGQLLTNKFQQTVSLAVQLPVITGFSGSVYNPVNQPSIALNWTTQNASSVEGSWTSLLLNPNPAVPTMIDPPFSNSYTIYATDGKGQQSKPSTLYYNGWIVASTIQLQAAPVFIAITPDSTHAVVGPSGSNSVAILDMTNPQLPPTEVSINYTGNYINAITITPDGKYALVTADSTSNMWIIDLSNPGAAPQIVNAGSGPQDVSVTPNGTYALVANYGNPNTTNVFNLNNLAAAPIQINSNSPYPQPQQSITISPDSTTAVIAYALGNLGIINLNNLSQPAVFVQFNTGGNPSSITITPDSQYAFASNSGSYVVMAINLKSPGYPTQLINLNALSNQVITTPNGEYVLVGSGNALKVIEVASNSLLPQSINLPGMPMAMVALPNSNYVFTANNNGSVSIIDVNNLFAPPANVFINGNGCSNLVIAPNASYLLVSAFNTNTITVLQQKLSP